MATTIEVRTVTRHTVTAPTLAEAVAACGSELPTHYARVFDGATARAWWPLKICPHCGRHQQSPHGGGCHR